MRFILTGKRKKNIKNLKKLLCRKISEISKGELIKEINKIIGDLTINDTYVG